MPVTASAFNEKGKVKRIDANKRRIFHLKREPMTGSFNKLSYDLSLQMLGTFFSSIISLSPHLGTSPNWVRFKSLQKETSRCRTDTRQLARATPRHALSSCCHRGSRVFLALFLPYTHLTRAKVQIKNLPETIMIGMMRTVVTSDVREMTIWRMQWWSCILLMWYDP